MRVTTYRAYPNRVSKFQGRVAGAAKSGRIYIASYSSYMQFAAQNEVFVSFSSDFGTVHASNQLPRPVPSR